MPETQERHYHQIDLDELMAAVKADKLIAEWKANTQVQYALPLRFTRESGRTLWADCAAAVAL